MMGVMMGRGTVMMVSVAHVAGMGSTAAGITSSMIGRRMMLHRVLSRTLSLVLLSLASLIVSKIIKDTGRVSIAVEDPENLDSLGVRHLLSITRIRHWLVLIVF